MSVTTVRLQAEVEQNLEAIAGRLHRSKGWVINQALLEYIEKQQLEQERSGKCAPLWLIWPSLHSQCVVSLRLATKPVGQGEVQEAQGTDTGCPSGSEPGVGSARQVRTLESTSRSADSVWPAPRAF